MNKKYLLLIIPLCIICILFIILVFPFNRSIRKKPVAQPAPTPVSTGFPPSQQNQQRSQEQIIQQREQTQGEAGMTKEEGAAFVERAKLAKSVYEARKRRLPFITKLPYQTAHFKVEIQATSDLITITTYGTTTTQQQTYRQEALSWLQANGGNPSTLTIRYVP